MMNRFRVNCVIQKKEKTDEENEKEDDEPGEFHTDFTCFNFLEKSLFGLHEKT